MGYGSWSHDSYVSYSASTKRASVDDIGVMCTTMTNQEMFKSRNLDPTLNPKGVIRECCDNDEHPETVPVILALDVTGSMGQTAVEVAKKLNVIMTKLYEKVKDVEFLIMGIGDFAYDLCPLQASQFESDIRIAEQLDKIYFEFGGGGNSFESYTAAWYFGLYHTKLDCWGRNKRGIIITMGDECMNPYLPVGNRYHTFEEVTGDPIQEDIKTNTLYNEVVKKFDIYHLDVNHRNRYDEKVIAGSWLSLLDRDHFKVVTMDEISDVIIDIILNSVANDGGMVSDTNSESATTVNENGEITW